MQSFCEELAFKLNYPVFKMFLPSLCLCLCREVPFIVNDSCVEVDSVFAWGGIHRVFEAQTVECLLSKERHSRVMLLLIRGEADDKTPRATHLFRLEFEGYRITMSEIESQVVVMWFSINMLMVPCDDIVIGWLTNAALKKKIISNHSFQIQFRVDEIWELSVSQFYTRDHWCICSVHLKLSARSVPPKHICLFSPLEQNFCPDSTDQSSAQKRLKPSWCSPWDQPDRLDQGNHGYRGLPTHKM